jgi:lysophospholipase L1-like esterase
MVSFSGELTGYKQLLLLGDSIVAGLRASSVARCFASLVQEAVRQDTVLQEGAGLSVTVRAEPGYALSDLTEEREWQDVLGLFSAGMPSVTVLHLGTNDIYNLSKAVEPEAFGANLRYIAEGLGRDAETAVILTAPPRADERRYRITKAPHSAYIETIYKTARELELPVVDYAGIDFVAEGLFEDGVHPNDRGHFRMAQVFCNALGIPFRLKL